MAALPPSCQLQSTACIFIKQHPGQPKWRMICINTALHAAAAIVEAVQLLPHQVSS